MDEQTKKRATPTESQTVLCTGQTNWLPGDLCKGAKTPLLACSFPWQLHKLDLGAVITINPFRLFTFKLFLVVQSDSNLSPSAYLKLSSCLVFFSLVSWMYVLAVVERSDSLSCRFQATLDTTATAYIVQLKNDLHLFCVSESWMRKKCLRQVWFYSEMQHGWRSIN